ncbi:hypothetical protein [Streptomyces sp. NPDC058745]|uniref:hypothetical protein n=1 Tax=Streptomyces sp. NPDC058745 TaxID=3346621 RepID=UPI003693C8B6
MASRTSDHITVASVAVAGALLTQQVYLPGAPLFATLACGVMSLTNTAFTVDALRRNRVQHTVTCPHPGCAVTAVLTGAQPAEQIELITLTVDHSKHGAAV